MTLPKRTPETEKVDYSKLKWGDVVFAHNKENGETVKLKLIGNPNILFEKYSIYRKDNPQLQS